MAKKNLHSIIALILFTIVTLSPVTAEELRENPEAASKTAKELTAEEKPVVQEEETEVQEEKTVPPVENTDNVIEEKDNHNEKKSPIKEAENIVEVTAGTFVEQTSPIVKWIKGILTWENLFKFLGVAIFVLILWFLYKLIVKGIRKSRFPKLDTHKKEILIRFLKYVFYTIIVIQILGLLGINFSALWGAAGIAGVAIGFAAQTSVSNLISGLFVITEGSLKLGDLIEIGDTKGIVDSINLLSVRIHTLDNQMVRIPNSTIIDSNLINISYHKNRRLVVGVSISYDTDMRKALEILQTAPELVPTVLQDPAPSAWFTGFGDSAINMELAVWFNDADFLKTKNDIFIAVKKVFDDARIEIPFNQLDVTIKEN